MESEKNAVNFKDECRKKPCIYMTKQMTTTGFLMDVKRLVETGSWYIKRDDDDEIEMAPTVIMPCSIAPVWTDENGLSKNVVLRLPNLITKEWLMSIIDISSEVQGEYPQLTTELIAEQLIKNAEMDMMIPLRRIHIISHREMVCNKRQYLCGLAEASSGEIFIRASKTTMTQTIAYNTGNFWSTLCHEIRHIGLECNPVFYNPADANEESVERYGMYAYAQHDWDDSIFDLATIEEYENIKDEELIRTFDLLDIDTEAIPFEELLRILASLGVKIQTDDDPFGEEMSI